MVSNKKYIGPEIKNTPEGWSVAPLGECIKGNGRYGINESASDYDPQKPRYLRITDIDDYGNLKQDGEKSVDSEDYAKYLLEEGEIVFARTGNTVGKTYLHKEENGKLVYAGYLIKFEPDPNIIRPKFLKLYTDTAFYRNWIQAISQRSGQPGVNSKEYRRMPILLPPIKEQDLILEVINAWDKAISKVQKLIKAKKRYKKGLMQRLLSGKVRFPEFKGEDWVEVRLKDLFTRIRDKNEDRATNILTISSKGGFLDQSDKFGGVIAGKNLENYTYIKRGDFAYNKGNSLTYPQGCIFKLEDYDHAAVPNVYYCFRPKSEKINTDFYKYYFELGLLNSQLKGVINMGVRNDGLLNLSAKDFFNIKVLKPSFEEQTKIANALSPFDQEIELYEQQLKALKKQKKGLMQKLLTGKVRVNNLEVA